MSISIRHLHKRFGNFTALAGIDLDIAEGELVALLGPSGCGKTTLLRLIAGLEIPDQGSIHLRGLDVSDWPARRREVGFVFQNYALFRHMSVFENVAFGLRVRPRATRPKEAELRAKVLKIIELVQLDGLDRRYPDQLSGGQRQRVALARALVIEPKVLLLDEPFGALDEQVRRQLRRWLRHLHDELHITSVFVTHDQDEAQDVADRIVLLHQGRIVQVGDTQALHDHPASVFVSRFLGEVNLWPGQLRQHRVYLGEHVWDAPPKHLLADGPVDICVRPYDLLPAAGAATGALGAQVIDARWHGGHFRLEASTTLADLPTLICEWPRSRMPAQRPQAGDTVFLQPERMTLFARGNG